MDSIQKTEENLQAAVRHKLLTPEEAAAMLRTTPGVLSVWRTTRRYPLHYVKIGRSVRYRLRDVEDFINSRVVEG